MLPLPPNFPCGSTFSHQPVGKVAAPAFGTCFFRRNKVSFYFTLLTRTCLFLCLLVSKLQAPSEAPWATSICSGRLASWHHLEAAGGRLPLHSWQPGQSPHRSGQ